MRLRIPTYRKVRSKLAARRRQQLWNQPPPAPYDPVGAYLSYGSSPTPKRYPAPHHDEQGIPLFKYGEIVAYNPLGMANVGLNEISNWTIHRDSTGLALAEQAGKWLCDRQQAESGAWLYEFDFPVSAFGRTLTAPWSSAMAQGVAISFLTRLYRTTNDRLYLSAAEAALAPLERDVPDGGLRADFFGHAYFEEYPTDPPSFTLNGFMFTLLGLHDLATVGNEKARSMFEAGMETLVYCLPFYDARPYSAYHLGHITRPPRAIHATPHYHREHIRLIWALHSVWPHETLEFYARRWNTY